MDLIPTAARAGTQIGRAYVMTTVPPELVPILSDAPWWVGLLWIVLHYLRALLSRLPSWRREWMEVQALRDERSGNKPNVTDLRHEEPPALERPERNAA
jgi:hypothetical protein